MNRNRLILLGAILLLILFFFWFDLDSYLTLERLKANRHLLLQYYQNHAVLLVTIFMAIYISQTALALPGATILSLAAGAVFGPWLGTLYAVSAAAIGAALSFLFTRYLLRDIMLQRFGTKMASFNQELEKRGFNYLLFLRLVPIFPFFLINLAAGVTHLRFGTFALATLIGIIPGGFVFVNAGASLASITSLGDVASPRVLGSFALLGLFALIPALYSKFSRKP